MTESAQPAIHRRSFLARAAVASTLAWPACRVRAEDTKKLRVLAWCEGTAPRSVYPDDVDGALASHLGQNPALQVSRARLADPSAGLADSALDATDVLLWWGHLRHDEVPADRAQAIALRVREGKLGLVALHSSCGSRPFRALMGMSCEPGGWREDGRPEHVKVVSPDHRIARGVAEFTIPRNDTFAGPFDVPPPESVILESAWDQGESFRSGLTWTIGKGRVAFLRTGHDAFPVLFHPAVRRLVSNAALWTGRRA